MLIFNSSKFLYFLELATDILLVQHRAIFLHHFGSCSFGINASGWMRKLVHVKGNLKISSHFEVCVKKVLAISDGRNMEECSNTFSYYN